MAAYVTLLQQRGPELKYPYSSGVESSTHSHMRELRVQHQGRPYRVLYAFDPNRSAILLIGGDKTGNGRWYEIYVPIADKLYAQHIAELENHKGENNGGKELQGTAGQDVARVSRKK